MLSVINLRVCRSSVRAISNASCDSDTAEFAAITAFSDAFALFRVSQDCHPTKIAAKTAAVAATQSGNVPIPIIPIP
jgi:hypothetical protein